jgi:hypothetical protein
VSTTTAVSSSPFASSPVLSGAGEELRVKLQALVERHGHMNLAAAAVVTLSGYASGGMASAAAASKQVLRDDPAPHQALGLRVSAVLRRELADLLRQLGHQAYCMVLVSLAAEYVARGARAIESDTLAGHTQAGRVPCPACKDWLASALRWREIRDAGRAPGRTGSPVERSRKSWRRVVSGKHRKTRPLLGAGERRDQP